ncbi:valine--tRNA ligase [Salinispora cortesiana]|uniref:valine--tRNA ligase n=1 Tax=Salinispora cortesiana TaxID=1305843 RepID=UPI00040D247B|nr:valine--tRNA ligase [Salinispora cortesiana]
MSTDQCTHARPDIPTAAGAPAAPPPYDHIAVERAARELWESHDIYRYDPAANGPVFSIDTAPPYVSASHLHVGHAMSYSQPDFVVRYRRMRGDRIFYPMGFDDNGLPTERYVEHKHGIRAADMPRAEFVALCLAETRATTGRYADLWRRLGLSVDWSLSYSTIDQRCQRTAQAAFVTLHAAGHVRRATDPILWCPECRTSLAQADIDDLSRTGRIHDIRFAPGPPEPPVTAASGGGAFEAAGDDKATFLTIATTRPELLAGCVALYCHPADDRYAALIGGTARVPIFGHEVPIRADEAVDPGFGTGLMMVCSFGDGEDVIRWRRDGLDLRMALGPDGRLTDVAGEFAGLPVAEARTAVVRRLAESGALGASRSLRQVLGVHERCGTPVEFQIRPQWFIAVRDKRDALLARARELTWVPPFMRRRLEDWITGLKWDWNISRQRHYGVPFPVWFCADCDRPILAEPDALPVDPLSAAPPVAACPECGGAELRPDTDVMDTWMTSSLSPQIHDGWAARGRPGDGPLTPMSLRVQAFEIIRTWLFYTIVQSHLLADRLPWTAAMISGWGLNEQGRKISKRDLEASATADGFNRYVPDQVIERYGADALRLWAARPRIGNDLRYHEKDVRTGRKLAVKLWNVGRFVGSYAADPADPPALAARTAVDRWVLSHLADAVRDTTGAFEEYDYAQAYRIASTFCWSILCDRYIELVKIRFTSPAEHTDAERAAARATLREVYRTVLGLLAPFAPFITEDQYQRLFRTGEGTVSLHLTQWPGIRPEWTESAGSAADRAAVDRLVTVLDAVRASRTRHRLGGGASIEALVLDARTPDAAVLVAEIAEPLRAASRARAVRWAPADTASGVDDLYVDIEP